MHCHQYCYFMVLTHPYPAPSQPTQLKKSFRFREKQNKNMNSKVKSQLCITISFKKVAFPALFPPKFYLSHDQKVNNSSYQIPCK